MYIYSVGFLKTDPRARYQGYMFYFREGFCWTNILNPNARLLKAKLKQISVNDVGSMSLSSIVNLVPNHYLISLLNSDVLFDYYREFINVTVNIQINDIRQLPIIIPDEEQLNNFKELFEIIIKSKRNNNDISSLELKMNNLVNTLYGI